MTTNILEMRGITKTFPGVKALQDVTSGGSAKGADDGWSVEKVK